MRKVMHAGKKRAAQKTHLLVLIVQGRSFKQFN